MKLKDYTYATIFILPTSHSNHLISSFQKFRLIPSIWLHWFAVARDQSHQKLFDLLGRKHSQKSMTDEHDKYEREKNE